MYADKDFADAIKAANALLTEASEIFVKLAASPSSLDANLRERVKANPQVFDQLIQTHGHQAVQKWLGNGNRDSGVGGRPLRVRP